jgi:GMP synthase (glutamine-hydrolysing)
MQNDKVIILDFGSQYTQLIARRIRELNIFCEIFPFNHGLELEDNIKAIILSGSPFSVRDANALHIDLIKFIGKVPILAVCYGAQYIAQNYGGKVEKSDMREYGKAILQLKNKDPFFKGIKITSQVWMSHSDSVTELPKGFEILADTSSIPIAAYKSSIDTYKKPVYAIQFHPEVTHSVDGLKMLKNFLVGIAKCKQNWTPDAFVETCIEDLRQRVKNDEVLLGLSGGVDSSVCALLLHKAIGKRLICVFVDNGLLRKNEFEEVLESYISLGLNVIGVDAKQAFYTPLKGVTDPEKKRKIIGKVFIDVFEKEAKRFPNVKYLAQGTIYPDVIESVSVHGPSVTIKSHHNVGGLPAKLKLKIVEPLRMLFKDEVRRVGSVLELPLIILNRHPFPGPGLAIRILSDITPEKVDLLQRADAIFIDNLKKHGLYDKVWQAGAILLPVKSVGVMGDERTYENALALRCVDSNDGMTAEWSNLPYEFLANVSNEIINQVKGINRVVYDISTKPPATIEWE